LFVEATLHLPTSITMGKEKAGQSFCYVKDPQFAWGEWLCWNVHFIATFSIACRRREDVLCRIDMCRMLTDISFALTL